jgi:hypothetical protein
MLRVFVLTLAFAFQAAMAQTPPQPAKGKEVFQKVHLLAPDQGRVKEIDVVLQFEPDKLLISSQGEGDLLKSFPYAQIKSAEYSYSDRIRLFGVIWAGSRFERKHFLTIKTSGDYAVLRLDKENYKVILAALETRTGLKVETLSENNPVCWGCFPR